MTLANYLYALAYSDIYDESKWQDWAAELLKDAVYSDDTEWLFEVFLATDKQRLFDAIAQRRSDEEYFAYNKYVLTEIIQGYYYHQYISKTISLHEMLEKSGDVADAGQDSKGCEFFYDLLNQIAESPCIADSAEFQERISQYYSPLCAAAMEQQRMLEAATIEGGHS